MNWFIFCWLAAQWYKHKARNKIVGWEPIDDQLAAKKNELAAQFWAASMFIGCQPHFWLPAHQVGIGLYQSAVTPCLVLSWSDDDMFIVISYCQTKDDWFTRQTFSNPAPLWNSLLAFAFPYSYNLESFVKTEIFSRRLSFLTISLSLSLLDLLGDWHLNGSLLLNHICLPLVRFSLLHKNES